MTDPINPQPLGTVPQRGADAPLIEWQPDPLVIESNSEWARRLWDQAHKEWSSRP